MRATLAEDSGGLRNIFVADNLIGGFCTARLSVYLQMSVRIIGLRQAASQCERRKAIRQPPVNFVTI